MYISSQTCLWQHILKLFKVKYLEVIEDEMENSFLLQKLVRCNVTVDMGCCSF